MDHQPLNLDLSKLTTLNDFQNILEVNWIRPFLKLTTEELKPLFDILKGDSNPRSPRSLTDEEKNALPFV